MLLYLSPNCRKVETYNLTVVSMSRSTFLHRDFYWNTLCTGQISSSSCCAEVCADGLNLHVQMAATIDEDI